ncbi:MAG: hypothetical protein K6B67_03335 [Lachnospiraceae bacterium]|nr:hypothetical protein [Lachnospiraceae bacterium]
MSYRRKPFSELLQDRDVFNIFDEVFQKGTWLDVAALVSSDGTIEGAYKDGTIPANILDEIVSKLDEKME